MMNKSPLKFSPLYFSAPWGGGLVREHYARATAPAVCSESWEISGHGDGMSVVCDGVYAGRTLDSLVSEFGRELVGSRAPRADRFPLLFKLIDARWPLSIQVHPNEKTSVLTGGEPKTEAWYVVKAFPGAVLYAGLKHRFGEEALRGILANGSLILDQLTPHAVAAGDMLYIPGGLLHAIGGGCFIYEVQQSSDTTYRFYDWDRRDASGNRRPLHVEESFKSIDYSLRPPEIVRGGELKSPFFRIREVPLDAPLTLRPDGTSFLAGFVLSGAADIAAAGESFLVPASGDEVEIRPVAAGTKLLITEL